MELKDRNEVSIAAEYGSFDSSQKDKKELREEITDRVKKAGYLNKDWQIKYAVERIYNEVINKNRRPHKKQLMGWVCLVLAFVYMPFGALLSIPLSVYIIRSDEYESTVAYVGLIFSVSILLVLLTILVA